MALEWIILSYVAATEATMVVLLTLPPATNPLRKGAIGARYSQFTEAIPCSGAFLPSLVGHLLEARCSARCKSTESCSPSEVTHNEKSALKTQCNALLITAALIFCWMLFAVTRLAVREEQLNHRVQRLKNRD